MADRFREDARRVGADKNHNDVVRNVDLMGSEPGAPLLGPFAVGLDSILDPVELELRVGDLPELDGHTRQEACPKVVTVAVKIGCEQCDDRARVRIDVGTSELRWDFSAVLPRNRGGRPCVGSAFTKLGQLEREEGDSKLC